jgi:hypothetical protein
MSSATAAAVSDMDAEPILKSFCGVIGLAIVVRIWDEKANALKSRGGGRLVVDNGDGQAGDIGFFEHFHYANSKAIRVEVVHHFRHWLSAVSHDGSVQDGLMVKMLGMTLRGCLP